MAKLLADLFGAPAGEVYPRTFAAGEECPESLEEAATILGILELPEPEPVKDPEPVKGDGNKDDKAITGAPENKAK